MDELLHPKAVHHLPLFITAPGETDVLMVVTGLFLLFAVVMFGVFFFWLHSLPERIAHKSHKIQFEIVAVLALISLFTHEHIFWIAGLVLAFIDLPDFGTPLRRIAGSVERIAGVEPAEDAAETPHATVAEVEQPDEAKRAPPHARGEIKQADGAEAMPAKPAIAAATKKELSHA
jgi:hypothetical protein